MSLREYGAYLLYDRTLSESLILRAGRLTRQIVCTSLRTISFNSDSRFFEVSLTSFAMNQLRVIQSPLRLKCASTRQVSCSEDQSSQFEVAEIERKIIIPPSFTDGPRYMSQGFLDAMAIVQEAGTPSLFITMTCNPNWPEIKENLRSG
ncbi:Helitron helicase [Phytophthora megakarya]|uniref:Helitron helicase n=1 Tax=Phytophthora megakarya TaxID=4795 RepID=A0A225VAC9_9STRA|nr:Helitron helicase [Phytophthora megakarya]